MIGHAVPALPCGPPTAVDRSAPLGRAEHALALGLSVHGGISNEDDRHRAALVLRPDRVARLELRRWTPPALLVPRPLAVRPGAGECARAANDGRPRGGFRATVETDDARRLLHVLANRALEDRGVPKRPTDRNRDRPLRSGLIDADAELGAPDRAEIAADSQHDRLCASMRVRDRLIQTGARGSRGGGTRTPDLRFWRPPLYQLSYAPVCARIVALGVFAAVPGFARYGQSFGSSVRLQVVMASRSGAGLASARPTVLETAALPTELGPCVRADCSPRIFGRHGRDRTSACKSSWRRETAPDLQA